ncbi:MAG: hypothetical protein KDJ88_00510 [Bauldia sp.]|nr:hypothetical protein [Bauldia sp.]
MVAKLHKRKARMLGAFGRVWRDVCRVFYAGVIVLVTASNFPTLSAGLEASEKAGDVVSSKGVGEANEALKKKSAFPPCVLLQHPIYVRDVRKIGAQFMGSADGGDYSSRLHATAINHRVQRRWGVREPFHNRVAFVDFMQESRRAAVVGELKREALSREPHTAIALHANAGFGYLKEDEWPFRADVGGELARGRGGGFFGDVGLPLRFFQYSGSSPAGLPGFNESAANERNAKSRRNKHPESPFRHILLGAKIALGALVCAFGFQVVRLSLRRGWPYLVFMSGGLISAGGFVLMIV